jgi:hypothetical protein
MAVINVYPKLAQYAGGQLPSGDHQMTVDVWMNYNGGILGGSGSTEHMSIGLNQTGGGIGGAIPQNLSTLAPVGGPYPNQPGFGWSMTSEGGNTTDQRFWRSNSRFGPDFEDLNAAVGYVAQDGGTGQPGPGNATNTYYQDAFPFYNPANGTEVWYETQGGFGKHWTTVQMKYEDGIIYHYAKPHGFNPALAPPSIAPFVNADGFILIAARTDDSAVQGHAMLGYLDSNNGTAGAETRGTESDATFIVFDNMVVESITQTRQKWAVAGTANWSNSLAWQNGDVADGVTEVADFTTTLPSQQFVFVDSPRTVRSITFDSTPGGYSIGGPTPSTITLDSLTDGIRTTIKGLSGSHEITAPVVSKKPIIFNVNTGATVKLGELSFDIVLNEALTPIPDVVVKNGGGVAAVNRLMLPTGTNVTINAGTLRINSNGAASGVSVIPAINISGTGKLDLTDNKLVTPAAAGTWTGTAYDGVAGLVDSGRGSAGNAMWDGASGIVTSDTRAINNGDLVSIGVAKASEVRTVVDTETTTFAGQTVLGSDTLVMATWGGDANLDGKINIDDYGRIDGNVGQSGTVFGWSKGDFNYDGKINIDDYGIIDGNINRQGTPFAVAGGVEGVAAVPEPASLGVIALSALALLRRRRREN